MENLQEHLKEHNLKFETIPYVLQLNKRDLPNAMAVAELTKQLQKKREPVLESAAVTGGGMVKTGSGRPEGTVEAVKNSGSDQTLYLVARGGEWAADTRQATRHSPAA